MEKKDKQADNNGVNDGARRATEIAPMPTGSDPQKPDPEVSEKPSRRRFTATQKLKILKQIDDLTKPGEVGAFMRKNGLYSSTVSGWRRKRESGELAGLTPKKKGRKPIPKDPKEKVIKSQQKEIARLQRKLEKAETIIEIQKKVATLLGVPLKSQESEEND